MNVYEDDYAWEMALELETRKRAYEEAFAWAERYPKDPEFIAALNAAESAYRELEAWTNGARGNAKVSK